MSRATRISLAYYITIYLRNTREPAVEEFVTCYDYCSLDFSVSHVFHWLKLWKFRETECWLQHSYAAFNFLSIYRSILITSPSCMGYDLYKLSSAHHTQSETKTVQNWQRQIGDMKHPPVSFTWSLQSEASCVGLAQ